MNFKNIPRIQRVNEETFNVNGVSKIICNKKTKLFYVERSLSCILLKRAIFLVLSM